MRTRALCIIVLLAVVNVSVCSAEPLKSGPYMSGFIGGSVINNTVVASEEYSTGSTFNDKVEFDTGINIGATAGYNFGFFRLEGELSYKGWSMSDIKDQSNTYRYHNVDGNIGVSALMANGFVDLRNDSAVTPYFGGGVGFATIYFSDTYATSSRVGSSYWEQLYFEDNASAFAYQFGGGLEIAFNPRLSLDVSYRYFATDKARFENDWDTRSELTIKSHNASVGLRVNF